MRTLPASTGEKPRTRLALYRPMLSLPSVAPNASSAAVTVLSSARWANAGKASNTRLPVAIHVFIGQSSLGQCRRGCAPQPASSAASSSHHASAGAVALRRAKAGASAWA